MSRACTARQLRPHLRQPVSAVEGQRLGEAKRSWKTAAVILVGLCIPGINLLLPGMLGAGTAHLACRGLERVRAATGSTAARQVSLAPS